MKRAQRHTVGSVRLDKRRKTWNYLWYENGQRRSKLIGTKQEYPTKGAAWSAAESRRNTVEGQRKVDHGLTLRAVVAHYREENAEACRHPTCLPGLAEQPYSSHLGWLLTAGGTGASGGAVAGNSGAGAQE
jgi:hypothetical protein